MALHMQLMVNRDAIGFLLIQRLEPVGPPEADTVCTYQWRIQLHERAANSPAGLPVSHRYGDGAWVLVAKVLAAAGYAASVEGEQGGSPWTVRCC